MIGIEFTFNDNSKESYDPINFPDEFKENDTHYILNMTYQYEIEKSTVKSMRHYDLCFKCGHELYNDGCHNYKCINETEQ